MLGGIRYDYRTEIQIIQAGQNTSLVDRDSRGWSMMLDNVQRDVSGLKFMLLIHVDVIILLFEL